MNVNCELKDFCILCLIEPSETGVEHINLFSGSGRDLELSEIISKYFWFKIDESKDDLPKTICGECWSEVESFHIFYQSVEIVHRHYFDQSSEIKCETSHSKSINSPSNSLVENENYFRFLMDTDLNANQCDNADEINSSEENNEVIDIKCDVINEKNIENEFNYCIGEDDEPINIGYSQENHSQIVSNDTEVKSDVEYSLKLTSFKGKDTEESKRIADHFNMNCDVYNCELPTISFPRIHYRTKHDQSGYLKCCNQKFQGQKDVLEHTDWHINSKKISCKICAAEFNDSRALHYHTMIRHPTDESKMFRCGKCNKTFDRNYLLHAHYKAAHPDKNEKFECKSCQRTFLFKTTLRSHIKRIHERTIQHICEICGKSNISPSALRTHRLRHADAEVTQIACVICGDILKNVMTLKAHLRRHTDEPQQCKYCDKVSPNRVALNSHVTKSHGKAKFKCTMCDESFRIKTSLKKHIAMHRGENLYKCPYCPQTFRYSAQLYKHKKDAHHELLAQDNAKILQWEIHFSKNIV